MCLSKPRINPHSDLFLGGPRQTKKPLAAGHQYGVVDGVPRRLTFTQRHKGRPTSRVSNLFQVQPRSWHQRGQALHEFHWRHHVVAGAIAPRRLELQFDLPGAVPDANRTQGRRRAARRQHASAAVESPGPGSLYAVGPFIFVTAGP